MYVPEQWLRVGSVSVATDRRPAYPARYRARSTDVAGNEPPQAAKCRRSLSYERFVLCKELQKLRVSIDGCSIVRTFSDTSAYVAGNECGEVGVQVVHAQCQSVVDVRYLLHGQWKGKSLQYASKGSCAVDCRDSEAMRAVNCTEFS